MSSSVSPATPASSRSSSSRRCSASSAASCSPTPATCRSLGARQLLAEHDHARLRVERPGHRRVRHAAARGRRLRRHQPAAAPGDHRDRGRRVRPHFGINIWRIFVAAATDIIERRRAQGASTLTQQLARNLKDQFGLTKREARSSARSARSILAIQIEKRYTKREIFTIYCNQMYLGHGAYGVEAASRLYFNKSNKQLSLEEAALIAGIFQSPERQSPFVDMKRATQRRNVVLQRHGRRTLHHAGARPTPPSRSRSSRAASRRSRRASRRSSSRKCASTSNASTARRCCTRTASR